MYGVGFGYGAIGATTKRSGASFDSDALSFFTSSGITDLTQKNAVNQLVLDLKSNSLWTKLKALHPVVGGTASSHSKNLINPSLYNLTFSSGWTHSANGMIPNGTNAYADTNFNPSTQITSASSWSVGFYSNSSVTEGIDLGVDSGSGYLYLSAKFNIFGANKGRWQTSVSQDYTDTTGTGFYQGVKSASTSEIYKNGSVILNTASSTGSFYNGNIYLGVLNRAGANSFYASRRYTLHFIANSSFNSTEATNFYNIVQTFQTSLSRNV